MQCSVGVVLQFELDSFESDWTNPYVNFNLKNPPLQQLKNLSNYITYKYKLHIYVILIQI